ncbi:unnamed protein product [Gordionus sp. m RMFG-2023]
MSKIVKLEKNLGLMNGISIIVNGIIGSGIFISPAEVARKTNSVGISLLIWVISGLFSLIGAHCFTELGTMISKSGADYAYILIAFGPILAFLRLWVDAIIVRPASQAIVALVFAENLLKPLYNTCEPDKLQTKALALVLILLLTFINCWSVKASAKLQEILTYAKLLSFAIIIISGMVALGQGHTENFKNAFAGGTTSPFVIASSFYFSLFSYNGWTYLNMVVEELKDPYKTLPRSVWISLTLVTLIYVLINVSYFTVISPGDLSSTNAIAVLFAQRLYGKFYWVAPIFIALSCFGTVNSILFTSSRLYYVGARENQMPKCLTMIQVNRLTPIPAVLFTALLSIIYLLWESVADLISYVSFANWLAIGGAVVALLYLRKKYPHAPRPIKVSLIWPILYIILTIFLIIMPIYDDFKNTAFGALIILAGLPVYFLCCYWKNKPACFTKSIDKLNILVQKLILCIPEEITPESMTDELQGIENENAKIVQEFKFE